MTATAWPPWPEAGPPAALQRQVDVFAFPLDPATPRLSALATSLSADERERAARYRFANDRRAFVACRGTVREILGRHLAIPAAAVRFRYGPNGKPVFEPGEQELAFNVSHSGELGLCAVARGGVVGVDVERVRELPDALIAARFFSPVEHAALSALDAEIQATAFFAAWTRKEAFLKALGEGVSYPLDRFEVSLGPAEPAELRRVDGDAGPAHRWCLFALDPAPGYAAALVAESPVSALGRWTWPGD